MLVSSFALGGCSSNPATSPPGDAGASCTNDADCPPGACVGSHCEPCGPTRECPDGLHCLRVADERGERRECAATCDYYAGRQAPEGHACVSGAVVRCETGAPEAACWQCVVELGLADGGICPAGTWCTSGIEAGECVPQLGEGYSCSYNGQCLSGNCSAGRISGPGICQPAAGSPCMEGGACRWCDPQPAGPSLCAQSCVADAQCEDGQRCVGDPSDDAYACRALCTSDTECTAGYHCRPIRGDAGMAMVCVPVPATAEDRSR